MLEVKNYARQMILKAASQIATEETPSVCVKLRSIRNPNGIYAAVIICVQNQMLHATITMFGTNEETLLRNCSPEILTAGIVRSLPMQLYTEPSIAIETTYVASDGRPCVVWRNTSCGDLAPFAERPGPLQSATAHNSEVAEFLELTVQTAIEYVCNGRNREAQICFEGLKDPVWIDVHSFASSANGLSAHTNDGDINNGVAPSFHSRTHDPHVLRMATTSKMLPRFCGVQLLKATIIRRDKGVVQTMLIGDSETGSFFERA